jgi:hypothetical protein
VRTLHGVVLDADEVEHDVVRDLVIAGHWHAIPAADCRQTRRIQWSAGPSLSPSRWDVFAGGPKRDRAGTGRLVCSAFQGLQRSVRLKEGKVRVHRTDTTATKSL